MAAIDFGQSYHESGVVQVMGNRVDVGGIPLAPHLGEMDNSEGKGTSYVE
jgi:hypothetical protein